MENVIGAGRDSCAAFLISLALMQTPLPSIWLM